MLSQYIYKTLDLNPSETAFSSIINNNIPFLDHAYYEIGTNTDVTPLAMALYTANVLLKMPVNLSTASITRSRYTTAELSPINDLNFNLKNYAEQNGLTYIKVLHKRLTGNTLQLHSFENGISINIVYAKSGITNISKLMKYNNIQELNLPLQQNVNHTLRIYFVNNVLYIITTPDIPDPTAFYKKLTGCIPLVYNELFKNLKETQPELYTFFEKCYNNEPTSTCIDILKQLPYIKSLKQTLKQTAINRLFSTIETNLKSSLAIKIASTNDTIKDYERKLTEAYKQLQQYQRTQTTMEIPDKELIIPFLIKNKDVKSVKCVSKKVILNVQGKVDYDKKEILKTIKNKSKFIIWLLTHPNYDLHWEACCILNLETTSVYSYREGYTSELIANTHWRYYDCFGDNKPIINKALINMDFLTAFSKTITAAYQLNIYDITVLNNLIEQLEGTKYYNKTFFDKTDLSFKSTEDLYDIYKKEGEKENAQ